MREPMRSTFCIRDPAKWDLEGEVEHRMRVRMLLPIMMMMMAFGVAFGMALRGRRGRRGRLGTACLSTWTEFRASEEVERVDETTIWWRWLMVDMTRMLGTRVRGQWLRRRSLLIGCWRVHSLSIRLPDIPFVDIVINTSATCAPQWL